MNVEWEIGNGVVIIGGAAFGYFVANQAYKRSDWLRRDSGWSFAALAAIFFSAMTAIYVGVSFVDHSGAHEYSDDNSDESSD